MIELSRIVEEVRMIGKPAPTRKVWVAGGDIVRIEEDSNRTLIVLKGSREFFAKETPKQVLELMRNELVA